MSPFQRLSPFLFAVIVTLLIGLGPVESIRAQVDSCEAVREALAAGMQADTCQTVAEDSACYASKSLETQLRKTWLFFQAPNDRVPVVDIQEMKTQGPFGAAVMYVNTEYDPVKVIVFGDAAVDPAQGAVFTMRKQGGKLLCEKTPSGMMVQTRHGETGQVVVNGVTIKLASTAFISVEGVVLFDGDPRVERREGQRNPDAPLCSGFDSECNFDNCPLGYRLVWGPYCREDWYPYIEPGLYRITLEGEGQVEAGATDYNATQDLFAYGAQNLTLPASYTFCYPSLQAGGTGFETIVRTRSANARVDRIAVEYLGRDCGRAWTDLGGEFSIMTVTNMEGSVTVSALGVTVVLEPGEQVRIILQNGVPVEIGQPYVADALFNSSTLGWLGTDPSALPSVNIGPPGPSSSVAGAGEILFLTSREYESSAIPNGEISQIDHSLYAMREDGTHQRRVLGPISGFGYAGDFAVSPDGSQIAQSRFFEGDPHVTFYNITTGQSTTLTTPEKIFRVHSWSPQGDALLVTFVRSDATSATVLAKLEIATGELTELFEDPEGLIMFGSWSPDGKQVAFTQHYELWLINADGSGLRKLSDKARDVAWSPDGKWIAFEGGPPSDSDIDLWIISPDGSDRRRLTETGDYEYSPSWSPDARKLVYSRQLSYSSEQIFVMDIETGETTQLTFDGRRNASPEWLPTPQKPVLLTIQSGTIESDPTTAAVNGLLHRWDGIHREAISDVRVDKLDQALAGKALQQQTETVNNLEAKNCNWIVDVVEQPRVVKLDFTDQAHAIARVLKNWDMDLVCDGNRQELPENDGPFIAVYTMEHTSRGWRIFEKGAADVSTQDLSQPLSISSSTALPAPVYFIDEEVKQIFRLAADGQTLAQITNEPDEVTYFDVSPVDGSLVYVTNNRLIQTDGLGGKRIVKVTGELVGTDRHTEDYFEKQIINPRFSPDGKMIAFGLNGINLIASGESQNYRQVVQGHTGSQAAPLDAIGFHGGEWSPRGDKLAANITFYEGFGNAIVDLTNKKVQVLRSPIATDRGSAAWSPNGKSVILANIACAYCGTPGLSSVDAETARVTSLTGKVNLNNLTGAILATSPYVVNDDEILLFAAQTNGSFDPFMSPGPSYQLSRFSVPARKLTTLYGRKFSLSEVLWDSSGAGAVVQEVQFDSSHGTSSLGDVTWVSIAGAEIPLYVKGYNFRWGK